MVGKQPSICCSKFQFEFCGLINASLEFVFIYLSRVMDMVIKTLADTAMWQTMSLQGPVKSKFYFLTMKKKLDLVSKIFIVVPFQKRNIWEQVKFLFVPSFKCSRYRRISKYDIIILQLLLLLQRNKKDINNLWIIIIHRKDYPLLKIL